MVIFFLSCFCAFALFSIITWKDIYLFFIFFFCQNANTGNEQQSCSPCVLVVGIVLQNKRLLMG